MKRIFAPWRLDYITQLQKQPRKGGQCPFCFSPQTKPSPKNLILHKAQTSFVIMNRYPYVNGHLMVLPYRHISDFSKLVHLEHAEIGQLLSLSIKILKKLYKPQGFNIGMNLGLVAGAGIKDHIHYHIVPRWQGDHNFMPIFGETKVIMEGLEASYKNLRKEYKRFEERQ